VSVTFQHVQADGRFSFCDADGSDITVDATGIAIDDPAHIAYLDASPFVKRKKAAAKTKRAAAPAAAEAGS